MSDGLNAFRLDRTHLSVVSMHDPDDTTAYWLTRPVEERMAALEFLRQQMYGYDPQTTRLVRVMEVTTLRGQSDVIDAV